MHGSHEKPPRTGWGLPRSGTAHAPGASWAGEGQQSRPEPPSRGRGWRALLVVAVGVLLAAGALLLAGRGPGPEPVAERVELESAEVEVGACLATLPSDGGDPLDVVDCEQQHLGEVVAVVDLGEGEYPGEVAVLSQARERCASAFAAYLGSPVEGSGLTLLPVVPRENDWRVEGDRTVVCVAEGPALVGSVRAGAP